MKICSNFKKIVWILTQLASFLSLSLPILVPARSQWLSVRMFVRMSESLCMLVRCYGFCFWKVFPTPGKPLPFTESSQICYVRHGDPNACHCCCWFPLQNNFRSSIYMNVNVSVFLPSASLKITLNNPTMFFFIRLQYFFSFTEHYPEPFLFFKVFEIAR